MRLLRAAGRSGQPFAHARAFSKKCRSLSQLLSDSTLRSGDIVVTEAGIRVFRGDGTCPHKPTDFVALNSADLSRGKLRVLASLEVAMRAPHGRDQHR